MERSLYYVRLFPGTEERYDRLHAEIPDEVAAEILLGWGLPPLLASAVRHRAEPGAIDGVSGRLSGLLAAAEAGATAVIQPGGSMRDDDVIAAADEAGLAMVFTGIRHFRH